MYDYQKERPKLFTEEGQRMFLKIRDEAFRLSDIAGCFRADKVFCTGETWEMLACLDRMVELRDVVELTDPQRTPGQYRVFRRLMDA